jgi:Tol biopolymer transport system component
MTKRKRIIFAVLFILITLLLGFALYYVFFAPSEPSKQAGLPQGTRTSTGEQLPQAEEGKVATSGPQQEELPVTEEEPAERPQQPDQPTTPTTDEGQEIQQPISDNVDDVSLDNKGNARFYNEDDGKFYELNEEGKLKQLSDKTFFNVDKVAWSPKDDKAIMEYPDGSNIYYDFQTKQQETLPKHWEEFDFSPEGTEAAAKSMGFSPQNRWLIKSNPDGSSVEKIVNLGNNEDKVDVDWSPNEQVVGTSKTGEARGAYRQEVLLLGEQNQNFNSISVPGRGLQSKWSPSGEKLLYSVYSGRNNFKPELWIVNGDPGNIGQNRRKLNVDTWAEKCNFKNEKYVYCGVPTELREGAGFEPSIANNIEDNIYKINTETGAKTQIETKLDFTVDSLHIRENKLIIKGKNKSGLYEIEL